ncbi:hypothetical protein CLG96_00755 [Sphingomonas oleivorans]|uniref:Uncharacterized protein n=1 Tax=Sphingomonas oleivorans TaxID=1735121 RepID=A0A2T5G338_9SPHN|nr:dimethylamine monooxygenase subunit DmmA family protein [Sphingomonas oleivorans]PTQ13521.1 hypothetical protein CLG96_00755 [Sphingomonas oleivorans]
MNDQGIKSRPAYAPLARDPVGRTHLLVADSMAIPHAAFAPGTSLGDYDECWTVEGHSRAIPSAMPDARMHGFRSASHLLIALRRRLAMEYMGFRLYAIGTEAFLWDVAAAAEAAGMGKEEYALFHAGSGARRVLCVHCRTLNQGVTTNLVACGGCGAALFVRDHFSRRLNAYMGVQVDAEMPGERPDVEEIYR